MQNTNKIVQPHRTIHKLRVRLIRRLQKTETNQKTSDMLDTSMMSNITQCYYQIIPG